MGSIVLDGDSDAKTSNEGSQAAIQRRKRPKRRSTGVVDPNDVNVSHMLNYIDTV